MKTFLLQETETKLYYNKTTNKDLSHLIRTGTTISFGSEATYLVIQEIEEI